ncbi:MAG: deoxyhypusine synthase [Candidatus Diapherotrites archaeon]|nr:deoxyhypusine synthase [Candidatus Diapherotrites archaeon]
MTRSEKGKEVLTKPVDDIHVNKDSTAADIIKQMGESGGFTASKVAKGVDLISKIVNNKEATNFLAFPACLMATGCRGVLVQMVKEKMVDAVVTTVGTISHDIIRLKDPYYAGSFEMDDKWLHEEEIFRLGNVLIKEESFGESFESKMLEYFKDIMESGKNNLATHELMKEIGLRINDERSFLYWCAKNDIPVIIPAITDGATGTHLWQFIRHNDFYVDVFKDENLMSDLMHDAKEANAIILGGGLSKHHIIWWAQFREGLDNSVYITTAPEYDGSLSGARVREAISWGKVKEEASYVTVEGDATVLLPFMMAAVFERYQK